MRKTICLNMIVKDEAHVIKRCLASVLPLIDYWVIVDTGSTDGTQHAIRDFLQNIPGELYERSWVNFAHNRNEALNLARGKADYFLFIDADDRLVISDSFAMPDLDKDFYLIQQHMRNHKEGNVYQPVIAFIQDLPDFHWEGALHEQITCNPTRSYALLPGIINEYFHDGNRSQDPGRFEKDVRMLTEAIREDPCNRRNVYYLAHTYLSGNDYLSAIRYYELRAEMGGNDYEVYISLYYAAHLQKRLHFPPETFLKNFGKAYLERPSRAESLYQLASYYEETGSPFLGYLVAKLGVTIPKPIDVYVEPEIYDWAMMFRLYECARQCGQEKEACEAREKLLANPLFPHYL